MSKKINFEWIDYPGQETPENRSKVMIRYYSKRDNMEKEEMAYYNNNKFTIKFQNETEVLSNYPTIYTILAWRKEINEE